MSNAKIHSSLSLSLACCIISLIILKGSKVEFKGSPAYWKPFNILKSLMTFDNRFVIIFIIAFLGISNKVIGLVFTNLYSQGFGFGIGYILAFFQSNGISCVDNTLLITSLKSSLKSLGAFLISLYAILVGPHAFFIGKQSISSFHSSSVI